MPPGNPRRSRVSGVLMVLTLVVLAVGASGVGYVWNLDKMFNDRLTRLSGAFPKEADRPPATVDGQGRTPVTILFLGSAKLPASARAGGTSADTVMVLRVSAARDRVDVLSIPADAMVPIPGVGRDRISAATTHGGLPLAISTVEDLLDTRIDHVAVLDLDGVKELTDAVDGVDVEVARPFSAGRYSFSAGINHIDGDRALALVREQRTLPGRDLDRADNQHRFLRGLAAKTISAGTLSDPGQLQTLLTTVSGNLAVDSEFDANELRTLALQLRSIGRDDLHLRTLAVHSVTGTPNGPLVVELDEVRLAQLRQALADGDLAALDP